MNKEEEKVESFHRKWREVSNYFMELLGKRPDLNAILLLIGIQELGQGVRVFSKEEKQDLMHMAMCKVLSYSGYYELEGQDKEGWIHWKSKIEVPFLELKSQERFIKTHIIEYFDKEMR